MARPGLDKHVKFRRLVRMLGEPRPHIRGYLEFIWETAYENGDPVIGDSDSVEAAAEWPGEPGKLTEALLGCGGVDRTGFMEPATDRPGEYQVHDLYDHAPGYVQKRMEREAARLERGETLSQLRAEAGRKGGSKRKQVNPVCLQTEANGKQTEANGETPAPAPAPKEEHSLSVSTDEPTLETLEAAFISQWNRTPGVIPNQGDALTPARRKKFITRVKDHSWRDGVEPALAKFPLRCFQDDDDPWRPNVDWFLRPNAVTDVIEGKYDWSKSKSGHVIPDDTPDNYIN